MPSHRIPLVAALLTAGLLLVACGGDDAADGGTEERVAERVEDDGGEEVTTTSELPAPADGPAPDLEVAAASVASPLPAVVLRRLNGEGGWVQLKNELPSEQPLLVWFWAPF